MQESWTKTAAVVEHLRMVEPNLPEHLRDLGLIHYSNGSLRLATGFLEAYLRQATGAPDAEWVARMLGMVWEEVRRLN